MRAVLLAIAASYPVERLPEGNRRQLAISYTRYGKHLVALGKDAQLWHLYERAGNWSEWAPLTSVCPSKNETTRQCRFDGDPAVGVNADGRLEVFARFEANLDIWQLYQTDAQDPTKWSTPREASCVDQDQNTAKWFCIGFEPSVVPPEGLESSPDYFVGGPLFPTSDLTVVTDPSTNALVLFYRGFTGGLFSSRQRVPGNSTFYTMPVQEGKTIIESTAVSPKNILV